MKICYLVQDLGIPLDGEKGASAHVRGFVRALKACGHEVMVVSSSQTGDLGPGIGLQRISPAPFASEVPLDSGPRVVRALNHIWNNVHAGEVLESLYCSFKPDLVYERLSPFAVAGSALSQRHHIPHYLEVNALLAREGNTYRKQSLGEAAELLESCVFQFATRLITVSEALRVELLNAGIPGNRIHTLPNGVDTELFARPAPCPDGVEALEGKTVIGFAGSLKPWHDIPLLADLFTRLASGPGGDKMALLVAGDGPQMKQLSPLKDAFPNRVLLAGAVSQDEIPAYLKLMDIAVAPYPHLDPFYFSPLKILEYMASGRAIVATRIGQIPDLVRHDRTALLVEPGDVEGWVKAVCSLAGDPGRRKALGDAAAHEANMHHGWPQRIRELEPLFQKDLDARVEMGS